MIEEEEAAERLTPREIEGLRLLAEGLANKEIAARLGIREHTGQEAAIEALEAGRIRAV